LIHLNVHFRATHDLVYLIDLIVDSDKEFEEYYDLMSEIQSYAVEVRYPNETVFLTNDKVKVALISAKKIRDLVTYKMGVDVKYNDVIDQ